VVTRPVAQNPTAIMDAAAMGIQVLAPVFLPYGGKEVSTAARDFIQTTQTLFVVRNTVSMVDPQPYSIKPMLMGCPFVKFTNFRKRIGQGICYLHLM
jgi:hypothetical protein